MEGKASNELSQQKEYNGKGRGHFHTPPLFTFSFTPHFV